MVAGFGSARLGILATGQCLSCSQFAASLILPKAGFLLLELAQTVVEGRSLKLTLPMYALGRLDSGATLHNAGCVYSSSNIRNGIA